MRKDLRGFIRVYKQRFVLTIAGLRNQQYPSSEYVEDTPKVKASLKNEGVSILICTFPFLTTVNF